MKVLFFPKRKDAKCVFTGPVPSIVWGGITWNSLLRDHIYYRTSKNKCQTFLDPFFKDYVREFDTSKLNQFQFPEFDTCFKSKSSTVL